MIEQTKALDLDEDVESEIGRWLSTEIEDTLRARQELELEWAEIIEAYEQTTLEEKKDFPFEGAACLVIPIVPMIVETMKSKIFTTIFAPKDPLHLKTRLEELQDFVRLGRKFLTWAATNELKLKERLDTLVGECLKLGTSVGKVVYNKETRSQMIWDEAAQDWVETVYVLKDNPEILHPELADVVFPLWTEEDSLNTAPWIAERFTVHVNELERWAQGKGFDAEKIETLKGWAYGDESDKSETERVRESGGKRAPREETITLWECWYDYAVVPGNDTLFKVVSYLHIPTNTLLKTTHGWFPFALHPYEILPYEKIEHQVYAQGVGKIATVFQKEISTQHNQRLDAMTIANANAFKVKDDSLLPDDIRIRPGGMIRVSEMDEIDSLYTGQKFDSTLQEEQNTLALLRERVGLQEYAPDTLAQAQSTTLTLALGESTRRFDQTVNRVRGFISRIMMKVMLMYQKYYPEGKPFSVLGKDGQAANAVLQFPEDYIYKNVLVEVAATTSVTSVELERQNKMPLFNLVTQNYGQLNQYSMVASNPQAPPLARLTAIEAINGLATYTEDVLDDYNLSQSRELRAGLGRIKALASATREQAMAEATGQSSGMEGVQGAGGAGVPASGANANTGQQGGGA